MDSRSLTRSVFIVFAIVALITGFIPATAQFTLDPINDALARVEQALSELAVEAESLLERRFSTFQECRAGGRRSCSPPACSDDYPKSYGFECSSAPGNATAVCGEGNQCGTGLRRSFNHSVVTFPPEANFNSAESEAFLCATKDMDGLFKDMRTRGRLLGWQYIADLHGAIRVYPGTPQERGSGYCGTYDVRLRPWFVSALSGPKDVVIVFDGSGSMASGSGIDGQSRIDVVRKAVQRLLSTFTLDDHVALVRFESTAYSLLSRIANVSYGDNNLVRADPEVIDTLRGAMSEQRANGGTRFALGFQKAFDILRNTNSSSGCTKIIMFLTDGQANDADDDIFQAIRDGQNQLNNAVHIHTYSMGDGADDRLPRQIACENRGVWSPIVAGEDPLRQMSQYYRFLETSAIDDRIRWSAPYIDAFGSGIGITAGRSVVDRSDNLPKVVGVVAADLTFDQLGLANNQSGVDYLRTLLISKTYCASRELKPCDFQLLRNASQYTCPSPAPNVATCLDPNAAGAAAVTNPDVNNVLCQRVSPVTRMTVGAHLSSEDVMCCAQLDAPLLNSSCSLVGAPSAGAFLPDPNSVNGTCAVYDQCTSAFCGCVGGTLPSSSSSSAINLTSCRPPTPAPSCETMQRCMRSFVSCVEGLVARQGRAEDGSSPSASCAHFAISNYAALLSIAAGSGTSNIPLIRACNSLMCQALHILNPTCSSLGQCDTTCATMSLPSPRPAMHYVDI